MTHWRAINLALLTIALGACAAPTERGTLAELQEVSPNLDEIYLDDSLERAAESYRRYLQETPKTARTPEAMRRLADLQIEQAYGVIGSGDIVEMAAPDSAATTTFTGSRTAAPVVPSESDSDFEQRATAREALLSADTNFDVQVPGDINGTVIGGPAEAIRTYHEILEQYPNYERNDKVLYQMSRAYDEIGKPDEAMRVMDRLVAEYPYSKYIDEVHFRRGEYFFIRKQYRDAEQAYGAIIGMGATSAFYELGLYKLGWTLYKQDFYEEALHNYMAMLDYRLSSGYDFDTHSDQGDEHRVTDTFRVISLSFSNLGGPEIVDAYFSENGHRSFADKIYGNLGEFYFSKLRYEDAASVYRSFIDLNPYHRISPHFGMRVIEIYAEAGFPLLVVESKKAFATNYALDAQYWDHVSVESMPDVIVLLKTNLTDLAAHYHALYQEETLADEKPKNFGEATHWYREFLQSFATHAESPQVNYRLADLLLENENFSEAAAEYERTAYEYPQHDQASAAGYAAIYAYRQDLALAAEERQLDVKRATVDSSLRFADTFPAHEEAPVVLAAAADDLYDMQDFETAIASAQKLIDRYPAADVALRRSAWAVVAHSSIDLAEYENAEIAYSQLLSLTPADDASHDAIVDGLAAAIYKQGEQANQADDYQAAAGHFLRIKDVAPTSTIRASAEYDAAGALIKLQDWAASADVLEDFRQTHPEHTLNADATKQLAFIYREDGQVERSAVEHERIAAEASDPDLAREALLSAAELYDEADVVADAIRVYESYTAAYPRPLDIAMESRTRLAELFKIESDYDRYYDELESIVAEDRGAGAERTDRSRYLAARAALVLAEVAFERFAALELVQPFEQSLATKQESMDMALQSFEALVSYEVAEVTAAATFYIAEIYMEFSTALMTSERPDGLTAAEAADYELVIEEEAYPFEERAIEVHEANFELLASGIYNPWVQRSLDQLVVLMPGRYAKNEISGGFLGSIDIYAYRMPIAPPVGVEQASNVERSEADSASDVREPAPPHSSGSDGGEE